MLRTIRTVQHPNNSFASTNCGYSSRSYNPPQIPTMTPTFASPANSTYNIRAPTFSQPLMPNRSQTSYQVNTPRHYQYGELCKTLFQCRLTFDPKGGMNFKDYADGLESFVFSNNIPDNEIMSVVPRTLLGDASLWFRSMRGSIRTFAHFMAELRARFQDPSTRLELITRLSRTKLLPAQHPLPHIERSRAEIGASTHYLTPHEEFELIRDTLTSELRRDILIARCVTVEGITELIRIMYPRIPMESSSKSDVKPFRKHVSEIGENFGCSETAEVEESPYRDEINALSRQIPKDVERRFVKPVDRNFKKTDSSIKNIPDELFNKVVGNEFEICPNCRIYGQSSRFCSEPKRLYCYNCKRPGTVARICSCANASIEDKKASPDPKQVSTLDELEKVDNSVVIPADVWDNISARINMINVRGVYDEANIIERSIKTFSLADYDDPFYARENDGRALLHIRLNGQLFEALADSGAQLNCLGMHFKWNSSFWSTVKIKQSPNFVTSSNTSEDKPVGIATLSVQLGNENIDMSFTLVEKLTRRIILGKPFLDLFRFRLVKVDSQHPEPLYREIRDFEAFRPKTSIQYQTTEECSIEWGRPVVNMNVRDITIIEETEGIIDESEASNEPNILYEEDLSLLFTLHEEPVVIAHETAVVEKANLSAKRLALHTPL